MTVNECRLLMDDLSKALVFAIEKHERRELQSSNFAIYDMSMTRSQADCGIASLISDSSCLTGHDVDSQDPASPEDLGVFLPPQSLISPGRGIYRDDQILL